MPDFEPVMTPEQRAMALQLLGSGAANQAGQQVNAPNRAAALAAQEQQPPVPPQTPMGGPAMQPPQGGPQQSGYMPQGIPKPNGGRMTPEQAKKLAEMLRSR